MNDTDTITLTRAAYEDLVDARDHALAMRDVATGAVEALTGAEVDAYLAAATPLAFWRRPGDLRRLHWRRRLASRNPLWLRRKLAAAD